jgi:hypothetical protein
MPELERLIQEDWAFEASLHYIIRSCLKKQTKAKKWKGGREEGKEGKERKKLQVAAKAEH